VETCLELHPKCRCGRAHSIQSRDGRPGWLKNHPGTLPCSLPTEEDRQCGAAFRKVEQHVGALCHGERQRGYRKGFGQVFAIHRDKCARDRAKIKVEASRRRAVDDTQPHAPPPFDGDHFRVVQRPVIGEVGIEVDIVDVHRHAATA